MEFSVFSLLDPNVLVPILAAVAVAATIITLSVPLLERDVIRARMRAVAVEREKIRARERERQKSSQNRANLRNQPKMYVKNVVEQFNLAKHLGATEANEKLRMAGFRGEAPQYAYLMARLMLPIGFMLASLVYFTISDAADASASIKAGSAIMAAFLGLQLPNIYLTNEINKRQQSVRRAFPDSLDLLLICVEAGMSIEVALRKVSHEIATQSIAMAEEFALTCAELSYLTERRQAYENLAQRTGLDGVKAVCMALIQAERYGTGLSQTLRVLAQENRDMRMSEAEKKAAALPPKLTVPMIAFFLPVLFVVILGPAIINVMGMQK